MTKQWIDAEDNRVGTTDDSVQSYPGATSYTKVGPNDGRDTWDDAAKAWIPYVPPAKPDPDADFQADLLTVDPLIEAIADPQAKAALIALSNVMKGKGPKGAKVKGSK